MIKRYQQDPVTFELIEIVESRGPDSRRGDATLWNDRGYQDQRHSDGSDISTRAKHKAFMQRTGLTTYDDFAGQISRAGKERDEYHKGNRPTVTKRDLERTMHDLSKG